MLKVNFLFEHFPSFNQSYIHDMLKLMDGSDQVDITIKSISKGNEDTPLNINIFKKTKASKLSQLRKQLVAKLKNESAFQNFLLKNNPDILHLQHSFLFYQFEQLLAQHERKIPKLVITLRGSDTYVKPWFNEKWRVFYKGAGQKVDAYVVQSQHQKEYLLRWGIDASKIHVIASSIPSINVPPKSISSKATIKVCSAFRYTWQKNISGNLLCIKHLVDKGYKVSYDIYGHGNDVGEIYYLRDYYGLQDEVNIKGKISNDALMKQLNTYDIYLQLSKNESLSVSAIEAQALGLPVIGSENTGMAEVIKHNHSGFTVPFDNPLLAAEKIETLINDTDLYHQFSSAAIANFKEHFTADIEVKKHLELYKMLMK